MSEDIQPNDRRDKISKKKNKKPSKRIILVTKSRVLFIKPGQSKIKKEVHLLDISEIKSSSTSEVIIVAKTFSYGLITGKSDDIINQIRTIYNQTFLGYPEDLGIKCTDVKPQSRLVEITPKDLPCGGFVETYSSLCDYYNIPLRGDICWDMANIVSIRNIKTFNMNEIEQPVTPGDIKAILSSLKYNTYFKSFVFNGNQLGKDQLTGLAETLKTNSTVEDLSLNNVGAKGDTLPIIATTLSVNKNIALTSIDLSNNPFEDKGLVAFSSFVGSSPRGIASLDVSNTSSGKVGIAALANALKKNVKMPSTLSYLNLANNKMEADGSAALSQFLANPNALRTLNISNTFPTMETIVGALVRGCLELRHLDLSDNKLQKKEVAHLTRFISSSSTLKVLNLSNTKVPVENLREIVVALYSNIYLTEINLDIKNNDLGIGGARMLASLGDKISNIQFMDLSENDFGDEGVSVIADGFCANSALKKLVLNGNFKSSKTKSRAESINSVINLIESECPLESLHLTAGNSKSPLKLDILPLIYALATNDSLLELDICGHQMGSKGAIALGKALQTNKTLHTILWDENMTGVSGFAGLLVGLERNLTLKNMPTPLIDIMQAHRENPAKLQSILKEIDHCIIRNQSPSRAFESTSSVGGTNLAFLASGQQQNIEKLINKIKSTGKKATDSNHIAVIKDAENTEKVIGGLHLAKEAVHASLEVELNQKLKEFIKDIDAIINAKKGQMTQQILETMQGTFKSLDPQSYKFVATGIQFGAKDVDVSQIEATLVKGAGSELSNRVHECFVSALEIASDYIYEKIELGLDDVFRNLNEVDHSHSDTPSGDHSPAPTRAATSQPSTPTHTTPTPQPTTPTHTTTTSSTPTPQPTPPPRTGVAAPPLSPEVIPQPVQKPGSKVATNSAVAAAIARNIVIGGPPPRKPAAPAAPADPSPSATPTTPTPQPSIAKSKPVVAPRIAVSTPTKTTPTSKDVKRPPSGDNGKDVLAAAPEGNETEELVHLTKSRPQMSHKRKPPTRRPFQQPS
eukprot:gene9748-11973_t